MDVDVKNISGNVIAKATIYKDGTVSCNGRTYDHPSWLRDDFTPNKPTYKYLIYQGKSLRDHGVSPY
jgi:hypothetical protein